MNNVQRLVKNTFVIYIRMLLLILIAFYTSRILLKTLGVVDFGVYYVVGSIASTFVSIKGLFSESIQRYLNVYKGKDCDTTQEQQSIFNISIIIHVLLVVVFVGLIEFAGSWLLNTLLNIPSDRMDASKFVFQMSVISLAISILSVPYDAVVIANEKMGFYAIISILDGLLKLLFVFLLPIVNADMLKTYSLLLVFIPFLTLLVQLFYCNKFKECTYSWHFEKGLFKEILSLSGWNFFGNISFSLIHEGINMLLNIFGGVVINAARAVAYQLKSLTAQLSNNTMVAIRPYVIQKSSHTSRSSYFNTIFMLSRISFYTMVIPISILILFCPQLLKLWLGEYPEYSILFTRLLLISILIRSLHEPLNILNMSLGVIKRMMIIESVTMLAFLAIVFVALRIGAPIWTPFLILALMEVFIIIGIVFNASDEIDFPIKHYLSSVVRPLMLIGLLTTAAILLTLLVLKDSSSIAFTGVGICAFVIVELMICYLFMTIEEKKILKTLIKKVF